MNFPWAKKLLNHEAIAGWNDGDFWFGGRRRMRAPGLLVMFTFAFYIISTLTVLSVILFHIAGYFGAAGKVMIWFSFLVNDNPDNLWLSGSKFVSFVILSFMTANIALAILDTAIAKAFIRENASRFFHAGAGACALAIIHLLGASAAEHYGIADAGWTKSGFSLSAVMALAFFALSAAFREGARMKEEQDLTV